MVLDTSRAKVGRVERELLWRANLQPLARTSVGLKPMDYGGGGVEARCQGGEGVRIVSG